jgi:AraC-like DNA-binding protein
MFATQVLTIFRYFYLLGAVNAFFFCLLVFSKKSKSIADKILGIWLIILSVQLIIPFLYLTDLNTYYKYAGYEIIFFVFHPVLLYLYVKATIGNLPVFKRILLSFIPIALAEIGGLSFFLYPAKERLQFIKGEIMLPMVYLPFLVFMMIYFFYYIYRTYKTLKKYKNTILHVYSYRENVDLFWLRKLVILFSGIILLVFPMGLFSYFFLHSSIFADFFFYLMLVLFVFLLGFWGYQQGQVFNLNNGFNLNETIEKTEIIEPIKIPVFSFETQKQFKKEAAELERLMAIKKPYLESTLTIHDLSRLINLPPYLLSKIINKEFRCNFFEFINKYRITEFKEKVISGQHKNLTILALALECGFNSKSAFNRIFKDSTGITPSDFIKHQPT